MPLQRQSARLRTARGLEPPQIPALFPYRHTVATHTGRDRPGSGASRVEMLSTTVLHAAEPGDVGIGAGKKWASSDLG